MGWIKKSELHVCNAPTRIEFNDDDRDELPDLSDIWRCDFCGKEWEIFATSGHNGIYLISYSEVRKSTTIVRNWGDE